MFEVAFEVYKYGMGAVLGFIAIAGSISMLGGALQWLADKTDS